MRRARGWAALLLALPALVLTACGGGGAGQREASFSVQIENLSGEDFYGLYVEYSLGEEEAGGQMAIPEPDLTGEAPEGPASFAFTARDLSGRGDLEDFWFHLWVVQEDGARAQAGERVPLPAEWGGEYRFALKGQETTYQLTPVGTPEAE